MPLKTHYKKLFSWLSAIFIVFACAGQSAGLSYPHLSIKPTTDFDQRFYYTPGETQNVWGYRLGMLVNERFKLGIGGYYMNKTINLGIPATSLSRTAADAEELHKKLYLGTVYYEPYLMRRNLWETSIVFETGYGRTVNYTRSGTTETSSMNGAIVPVGAGLSLNLKMPALFHVQCFRWIGINAMAGYRAAVYQQDKQYNYNGAYWSISGALFLDRVFEDYHAWRKHRATTRQPAELHF